MFLHPDSCLNHTPCQTMIFGTGGLSKHTSHTMDRARAEEMSRPSARLLDVGWFRV